jgi:DNA polymerase III delta prime subunit
MNANNIITNGKGHSTDQLKDSRNTVKHIDSTHEHTHEEQIQIITKYLAGITKKRDIKIRYNDLRQRKDKKGYWFYDMNRNILSYIDFKFLPQWRNTASKREHYFVRQFRGFSLHIYGDGYNKYSFQALEIPLLSRIWEIITSCRNFAKSLSNERSQQHINAWIIDVCISLSEMKDPFFWSPFNLVKFLARFYSIVLRFKDYQNHGFKGQSLDLNDISSIDVVLASISLFGVPPIVMEGLRKLALFTNKKILDTPSFFIDLFMQFFQVIRDGMDWMKTFLPESTHKFLDYLILPLDFAIALKQIRLLEEVVFAYNKNPQVMFKAEFREKVKNLNAQLSDSKHFHRMVRSTNYQHTKIMYDTFKRHIYNIASTYDTSARVEPLCFVFEGAPGTGKSTFMNLLVNYLVKKNKSVYNHTCTALESGKDFYDDYQGENVFVMDDVGQQGISQWRQIINFVSPVKYPLECASAELKNTKYFSSDIILITTNRFSNLTNFTRSDCISEPEALFRRCHVFNFDKCKNGKGDIIYKKFDHLRSAWLTKKFHPMHKVSSGVSPSVPLEPKRNSIAWVYHLMNHMSAYNKAESTRSDISEILESEIDAQFEYYSQLDQEEQEDAFSDAFEPQGLFTEIHNRYDIATSRRMQQQPDTPMNFSTKASIGCGIFKDIFSEFFSYISSEISEQLSTLPEISSTYLLGTIFGILGLLGAGMLLKKVTGVNKDEEEIINSFIVDWRKQMKGEGMYEEDIHPDNKLETLQRRMRFVELIDKNGKRQMFQAFPSGRRLISINHSHTTQEGILNVFKTWDDASNKIYELNNIPFSVIYENLERDVTIFELPLTVPLYKDSSDILFPANKIERNKNLHFINCDGVVSLIGNNKVNDRNFTIENFKRNLTVNTGDAYLYPISASGLCGSLLFDTTNGLVGMHIAGNTQHGVATRFSKEDLATIHSHLKTDARNIPELRTMSNKEPFSGARVHNADYPVKLAMKKTSLTPSELHSPLEDLAEEVGVKAPANLKAFGKDTILKMGTKSFGVQPIIDSEEIDFASKCIDSFLTDFDDCDDSVVIKGGGGLAPLNKNSVNGLGYENDKSLYINFEDGTFTPDFSEKLDAFVKDCEDDNVKMKDVVFYEALKDELKPIHKVNKPRTFRVAPLHHTVLCKRTMGKLLVHIKNNMWENQICIGMNPYKDFQKLYTRMKACDNVFDGDIGNWDGGTNSMVQDAVSKLVLKRYQGKHHKTLDILLRSMVRTFVNIRDHAYLTTHSMPSGCWVTALFNSLYNRFITAACFYRNLKKNNRLEEATVMNFLQLTDFVMGDDKICGVPTKFADVYNAETAKEFFESISMRFTDGEKGEINAPFKPLHDLVFLKRKFRYHHVLQKMVGALSLETVINSIMWFDSNKDYETVMGGKMIAFQFEMFLHENEEIKQAVLQKAAETISFTVFSDQSIRKSMEEEDDAYATVQRFQNKFYDY